MAETNEDYWLGYAQKSVTNSIISREKAADKLDDLLTWLWGIYTGVFVLASLFDFLTSDLLQNFLVIQPILIIAFARFFCKRVSLPNAVKADINCIPEIIEGHITIVNKKKKRLKLAVVFTIISILSLITALAGYNLANPNRDINIYIATENLKTDSLKAKLATFNQQKLIDSLILNKDNLDLTKKMLNSKINIEIASIKLVEKKENQSTKPKTVKLKDPFWD